MPLALTPTETAILKSKLQAGPDGFGARFEVDVLTESTFACDASLSAVATLELNHQPYTEVAGHGTITGDLTPVEGVDCFVIAGMVVRADNDLDLVAGSGWTPVVSDTSTAGHPNYMIMTKAVSAPVGDITVDATHTPNASSPDDNGPWGLAAASFRTTATSVVQDKHIGPTALPIGVTFDDPLTPGNMLVVTLIVRAENDSIRTDTEFALGGPGWTTVARAYAINSLGPPMNLDTVYILARCIEEGDGTGPWPVTTAAGVVDIYGMEIEASGTEGGVFGPLVLAPKRVSLDKSLQMPADQFEVEFANEGRALGWGTGNVEQPSVFITNSRCRIYQGYGSTSNYIQTFTGLLDRVRDHRDILTTTITGRSIMAILKDQNFSSYAPQTQDEYQATIDAYNHGGKAPTPLDRTTDNGVYLNMEASDVVTDILDRAGWPSADRDITPTSYVLDEYILQDGWSWGEAIVGDERITGMTGYALWDDEAGVIHFSPLPATSFTDPQDASYTFRTGEDITSLDDETDQDDLITRVKARGPLTNQTLKDTWTEVWRTSKLSKPVGIWYDPDQPEVIRVIDRGTKKMYRIRQSDRKILGSFSIADICPHPLGLSGDPSDDTIYWLLDAPWRDTGVTSGNKVVKVRRSDSHAIARYAIPDGRWSALKVSTGAIWLTNLDTDKLYKRSKTDLSAINSWHHSYSGTTQTNPSGVMVDGSDLFIFYANGGTTARFLKVSTSSPGHVVDIVKTAGTNLHGGEMDTTTHVDCYGDSDSLGLVAKFTLKEVVDHTREIFAEAIDVDLEDELGALAQMESREHDAHPDDADHPFEIRRLTLNLDAVTNLAQATETAERMLDERGHRKRIVDVGILGNPSLQKTDLIAQVDPIAGLSESALIDTYRSDMVAGGTYLGVLAVIPAQAYDDTPDEEDPAEDDDEIDENDTPDDTDPTPDPDVPAFYIAPDGDDSTGDGSIGNPWATIGKFASVAGAGDTLYCRGGSYTGVTRTIIGTGTGTPSGTASLPITVMAYPSETPVFHGPGSGSFEQFLMFTDGVAYWTIDGLEVQDFKVGHAGAIYIGRNAGLTVPTHHITVRNCTMTIFPEDAGPFNQLVYLSAYAEDCTVEDNVLIGAGANDGCGVNIGDHEPSPLRSVVQRNVFVNFGDAGAIWYNGDQNTGELLHNTFIDCIRDISLRFYDTVTVRDNASTAASGISNVNDAGTGVATMDHNFGSQTFDVDYTLLPGNTGINAASTGDDAGAIDSGT